MQQYHVYVHVCLTFWGSKASVQDKHPSKNKRGPLSSSRDESSKSRQDEIALTTGENRGVTKFTKGRLVGSALNQSCSSCCSKYHVDKRNTGSVAKIAQTNSGTVCGLCNHDSLFAALTPCTFAMGMSGNVNGDSASVFGRDTKAVDESPLKELRISRTSAIFCDFFGPSFFLKTEKKPAWRMPWQHSPSLGSSLNVCCPMSASQQASQSV